MQNAKCVQEVSSLKKLLLKKSKSDVLKHLFFFVPDIIESVKRGSPAPSSCGGRSGGGGGGPMRPMVDEDAADEELTKMMTKCWSEDPGERPDFNALKVAIRKLNK